MAESYSILSAVSAEPEARALAKLICTEVEFASQLCSEFAAAESSSNPNLSEHLSKAHDALQLIVEHNAHLKSSESPSEHQPAWPRHEALIRFDLQLHRLTTHLLVSKKWFSRHFSLRGSRLYYSDGKNGHPDTAEGNLAFMRSNPEPDGRYCIDLQGMRTLLNIICFSSNCVILCRMQRCPLQIGG